MELSHLLFEACQAHDMRIINMNTHLPGPYHTIRTHTLRYPHAFLRTHWYVTHPINHTNSYKHNRAHKHKYAHSLILPLIHTHTHTHPLFHTHTQIHSFSFSFTHTHTSIRACASTAHKIAATTNQRRNKGDYKRHSGGEWVYKTIRETSHIYSIESWMRSVYNEWSYIVYYIQYTAYSILSFLHSTLYLPCLSYPLSFCSPY